VGWEAPVYLLTKNAGTVGAGGDRRRYERHWTPFHLDVVVDDVDGAVARAVAAGARLDSPAKDAPYGRIAMLADPFGHGFCLLQFSERGYDALL
jgi:predicted enzyme related to lactoylglutathione lyase